MVEKKKNEEKKYYEIYHVCQKCGKKGVRWTLKTDPLTMRTEEYTRCKYCGDCYHY